MRFSIVILGLVFISFFYTYSCSSGNKAYSKSARWERQAELNKDYRRRKKYLEKRFKMHRKNQSPQVRKILKKELRQLKKELRRQRRRR